MKILFALLMVLTLAQAQHSDQPEKENSADLRSQTELFRLEVVSSGRILTLERTPGLDNYLRLKDGKAESIRKIDSREAKKMDLDFAKHFLKCQYEIPASEGKCEVTLRLNLKGEAQEICQKDEKKTQEFASFLEQLNQRF
jgi:hypothetical protein